MIRKFSLKSAGISVVAFVLIATSIGVAQGWHATPPQRGEGKSVTTPPPKPSPTTASKATVSRKTSSAKAKPAAKKSASSAGHKKGTAPAAATETTASASKSSRERRVNDANTSTPTPAASPAKTETSATEAKAGAAKPGRCDPEKDEHADLSGSYTGVINYPAAGMSGPATLTVTGNRFTLTSGSRTEVGNITAVVTCNYTAVAVMFGQWKTPQPGEPVLPPLPMLSLTATRKGDQLTLKPSASERREFLFGPNPGK